MQSIEHYERGKKNIAVGKCRVCSCTEDRACAGGCSWMVKDICSKCWTAAAISEGEPSQWDRPWCCPSVMQPQPSTIFWDGGGWAVRAAGRGGRSAIVGVKVCPFCAKELPDAVELMKLWKVIEAMSKKQKKVK